MENSEKTQVLLSLLNLRTEAMRTMRERVHKIVTTSVTLFMLFVGWVVQKKTGAEFYEIVFFTGIIIVFWVGNLLILKDIRRGFVNAHQIVIRIEQSLHLFQPDFYSQDGKSLQPDSWQKVTDASHFKKFEYVLSASAVISISILLAKYAIQ